MSIERAIEVVENQRLYCNDGSNFNDPFELKLFDRKRKTHEQILGLHIVCLTNSHLNKLMWSHYGDSHKGACLVVKVPREYAYQIRYTSSRIFTDSVVRDIFDRAIVGSKKRYKSPSADILTERKLIALIKDKKWLYEKEFRLVFDKEDEGILEYDHGKWYLKLKIDRVYLGVNYRSNDDNLKEKMDKVCEANKIRQIQMNLSTEKYTLTPTNKKSSVTNLIAV